MTKDLQTPGRLRTLVFAGLALGLGFFAQAPACADDARILPVLARNGMVVAQEARAARIGLEFLRQGGNAVDAAVATGFALAVTLPRAGNLGGGGFMLVHLARENRDIALDYREIAPAAATADMFLNAAGDADPAKSRDGGLGVGTPGSVAGLSYALARWGSGKFSLADILQPTIRLARDGVEIADDLADSLSSGRTGRFSGRATGWCRPTSPRRWKGSPRRDRAASTRAKQRQGSSPPCRRPAAE